MIMNKPLQGQDIWKDFWFLLQEPVTVLTVPRQLTQFWHSLVIRKLMSSRYSSLYTREKSGHPVIRSWWCNTKEARLTLRYRDVMNAVTARLCVLNNAGNYQRTHGQCPWFPSWLETGNLIISGPPLNEGSRYALVCVDILSGLASFLLCLQKPGFHP